MERDLFSQGTYTGYETRLSENPDEELSLVIQ